MAQVTVYLPEDVLKQAQKMARRQKLSLSAYVAELLSRQSHPKRWPEDFIDLVSRGGGDIEEAPDRPPESVDLE